MNETNKDNSKLDINELRAKGKELDSKLMSDENKQKAMSFATSLCIGLLKGIKACIETLHEKLLPKINAKLEKLEAKDTQ